MLFDIKMRYFVNLQQDERHVFEQDLMIKIKKCKRLKYSLFDANSKKQIIKLFFLSKLFANFVVPNQKSE